jgi:hypothetical protein
VEFIFDFVVCLNNLLKILENNLFSKKLAILLKSIKLLKLRNKSKFVFMKFYGILIAIFGIIIIVFPEIIAYLV